MKTASFYFEPRDIGAMCLEDVIEGGEINMVDPNGGAHIPTPKLTDPKVKLKKKKWSFEMRWHFSEGIWRPTP